ncbi:MAG: hypothetical protein AB1705_03880 [Verrucomicrobiota bacterium]
MKGRFQIQVDGEPREIEIRFGTSRDALSLAHWRFPREQAGNEAIPDALEYARLASKRWRYYSRTGATVASLAKLREAIRRNPKAEVAMIFVACATWSSPTPILGFAYFRRSWSHHLIVDFLSTHPHVIDSRPERIRGVGSGLLKQLIALAEAMKIPCVWGEATAHSAPFYERALNVERILDHFFIEDEVMRHCLSELNKSREQLLARRSPK